MRMQLKGESLDQFYERCNVEDGFGTCRSKGACDCNKELVSVVRDNPVEIKSYSICTLPEDTSKGTLCISFVNDMPYQSKSMLVLELLECLRDKFEYEENENDCK